MSSSCFLCSQSVHVLDIFHHTDIYSTKFWVVTFMGLGQKGCVTCGLTSSDPISVTPLSVKHLSQNRLESNITIYFHLHLLCPPLSLLMGSEGHLFQRRRKWSPGREELNSPGYSSWRTQANSACSILKLFLTPGNPHCLDLSLLSDRGCQTPDVILSNSPAPI